MPDESCRKCGGLLLEYSVCAKCRSSNQFMCRICSVKTEIQYHDSICFNLVQAADVDTTIYDFEYAKPKLLPKIRFSK